MAEEREQGNMTPTNGQEWVLSALEQDQLVEAHKRHVPRRHFKGGELVLLWALRIYLFFMMAVVIFQVWTGAR